LRFGARILACRALRYRPARGGTFSYTGTYYDIVNAHIAAVQANAAWFKSRPTYSLFGVYSKSPADNTTAATAGTAQGQLFARAFIADYLLQKRQTIANAGTSYTAHPGGSVTFSVAGSEDPDSISWGTGGTFANNGGGLVSYEWDLGNGNHADASGPGPTLSYSALVGMVGYGTKTIHLRVTDDEGSYSIGSATLIVEIPEPSVLAMLVGLAIATLLWRLRRR
jgi:hypothetical protein